MTRPFMQNGIAELERMFESGQADPQTLETLEAELKFRSVPRAATLLAKVWKAISGAPPLATASQEVLFEHKPAEPRQIMLAVEMTTSNHVPPAKQASVPPLQVSVEDACKILKVAANAPWDSIEQARRAIVELSRPDRLKKAGEEKCQALRLDALKANAALIALLQTRRAR